MEVMMGEEVELLEGKKKAGGGVEPKVEEGVSLLIVDRNVSLEGQRVHMYRVL